jgi:hypothetical protein
LASPNTYPSAFSLTGPDITALAGNYMSGSVLWVDSTSASASDANAGTDPELPKLTWTSAYAAAAAGDLILCQPGHTEVIAAANTLNTANVATIGLGVGGTRAKFTSNVAGAMWTPNAAGLQFFNCYFPASTAATTARISVAAGGTDCLIRGSYFECGVNDTTSALTNAAARLCVRDCDFVATASRPARAILMNAAVASCCFEDVSIDGGAYGWTTAAFGITTGAATLLTLQNIRLLNRSDFVVTVTGCSYRGFGVRSMDNTGSRVVIAA